MIRPRTLAGAARERRHASNAGVLEQKRPIGVKRGKVEAWPLAKSEIRNPKFETNSKSKEEMTETGSGLFFVLNFGF
jgi:hypothetical protein